MVSTVPIIKYDNVNRCSSLQCENDSHCVETIVLNNYSPEAEARCICHGYFTGPRCEAKLILTPAAIRSNYIGFTVSFQNASNGKIISDETLRHSLSYSIQYWKNASDKSCSIATNIYSPIDGIDGLQSDTIFTMCAITDPGILCVPKEVNVTRDQNCFVIRTLEGDDAILSQSFILPVAITVIVILVLFIFGIIFLLCRKYSCSYHVTKSKSPHTDWAKERRKEKQRVESKDFNIVTESSVDDLLIDNFPNSSIDRRITRQTGTSTFVPSVHNQSLPNVIEDLTVDDTEHESSHMLQTRNSYPQL